MNTEFPSRLPTVKTTGTPVSVASTQSDTSSSFYSTFQKQLLTVVKNAFKTLDDISDRIYDYFERRKVERDQNKKDSMKVKKDSDRDSGEKSSKEKKKDDDKDEDGKKKQKSVGKRLLDLVKRGFDSYKKKIASLQRSIEGVNSSIGSAIGGVFGQGLFGRMLGGIITKSLNFAISKVLVGFIFGNPLLFAIIAAIGTLTVLCVRYWKEIKSALLSLPTFLSDLLDPVLGWFGYSKADRAAKDLAEKSGLTPDEIKTYYGDNEEGRQKMIEDSKRSEDDTELVNKLMKEVKPLVRETMDRFNENIDRLINGLPMLPADPRTEITQTYINNYGIDPNNYIPIDMEDAMAHGVAYSPVNTIMNTNNTNVVNPEFDNVSEVYPTNSVNNPYNPEYAASYPQW